MTQNESFSNSLYTDQMHVAEHELSAFIAAVKASYGPEEAELSAEDWIEESELMDSSPRSEIRNWRAVTIAASARLANRISKSVALPARSTPTREARVASRRSMVRIQPLCCNALITVRKDNGGTRS